MDRISHITYKYKANSVSGEAFGEKLYNLLNVPQKNIYGARKAEILALVFGVISNTQVRSINWPYEDMDPETINRTLSREVKMENMVHSILKKEDNGARRIYGLTTQGHKRICKTLGIAENTYPLHKTIRFHEYALGLFFQSLISHGYDINFHMEQLISHYEIKTENALNKRFSVRADAVLYFKEKKYYIEQDMGTETIGKLVDKIKFYDDPKKVIIFSFYKAVKRFKTDYTEICRINDAIEKDAVQSLPVDERKMVAIYRQMDDGKSFKDSAAANISRYTDTLRLEKQDNFKSMRYWGMFNCIQKQPYEKELCLSGMHLYCVASELAYTSAAFRKFGVKGKSCRIFRRLFGKNIVYERFYNAHGVCFDECVHLDDGRAFIEYAEEDVAGLVRIYAAYKSIIKSKDTLIIFCNTDGFAKKIAELLSSKSNYLGKNLMVMLDGEQNIYEIKNGELIPTVKNN